ncbi:hypothetical protein IE077_003293 [Cardiosporidium cionae]|uniref:Uncharacterized protein n=1 Tax=Cardiosporidium cionae TaxID=476202 RepID=A0ABQ7J8K7_9APIC|nr:hypothetical protein IE077_003293 [Cardiosporidium cionae]|eukprot:KAF8820318.1 hypothetical protein IE077_003293 [Cardiosporidium cionae]
MFLNTQHAKQIYRNWNGRYGDPMLVDYFFNKSLEQWYGDIPSYSYWWVSLTALGMAVGVSSRHFLFNPDVGIRRSEQRRSIVDRWQRHMYALPYFNHFLRVFSLQFATSFIDNEPDFNAKHAWKIRPDRNLFYGRFPLVLSAPKYHVDDPSYINCSHEMMEKYYESVGYYPDRVAANAEENEDSSEEEADEE